MLPVSCKAVNYSINAICIVVAIASQYAPGWSSVFFGYRVNLGGVYAAVLLRAALYAVFATLYRDSVDELLEHSFSWRQDLPPRHICDYCQLLDGEYGCLKISPAMNIFAANAGYSVELVVRVFAMTDILRVAEFSNSYPLLAFTIAKYVFFNRCGDVIHRLIEFECAHSQHDRYKGRCNQCKRAFPERTDLDDWATEVAFTGPLGL